MRINQLFLSAVYKNKTKHKFKEVKGLKDHTTNLYWFTLIQELHPVPRKPLSIPLSNQTP